MKHKMFLHPDQPVPAPVLRLWRVLDQIQLPFLKTYWIGGKRNWRNAYYVPACISYRPGIQHRIAIDFLGYAGKWVNGNRKRALCCSELGIDYLAIKRDLTQAEMALQIGDRLAQLRREHA